MLHHTALMNVMVKAAQKAARSLKRDFNEVENLQVSIKGPGDFVSAADRRAEQIIMEELQKARPGFGFVCEESGVIKGSDERHFWYVDPLDGTTNFLHGLPLFAISIALEFEGKLLAGLVYNPISEELYWAERGKGAFCNSRRLRVAARRELPDMLLATGLPHMGKDNHGVMVRQLSHIMPRTSGVRRLGACSLDLAFVAAGRFDGYWEDNLNSWDMAAGIILVTESGGIVRDFYNGQKMLENGSVIVGNEFVIPYIQQMVEKSALPK